MDVSQEAREMGVAAEQSQEAIEKEKSSLEMAGASDQYIQLDRLKQNPDFQWFIENYVEPLVVEQQLAALDVKNSTAALREIAAHKHDFGNEILDLLESKRTFWENKAGIKLNG